MRLLFIIFAVLFVPLAGFAANVTITEDTTLVLPSDGTQYTLKSGSSFDSLDTGSGSSFVFSIPVGSTVTLISPDNKLLTNTPTNTSTSCGSGQSSVTIFVYSATTVTVTPQGSCGTTGGGTGGGGGGPPPALLTNPVKVPTVPVNVSTVPVVSSVAPPLSISTIFTKNLFPGMRGQDVIRLQELLARDKEIYPEGKITGFFGKATRAAIKRFQKKYHLPQAGIVGPRTRKKLGEVFGGK